MPDTPLGPDPAETPESVNAETADVDQQPLDEELVDPTDIHEGEDD